jgi:hypothetical protein
MTGKATDCCARCGATLMPETAVHLWDGRDYCRPCVEAACPGMADYAEQHEELAEEAPFVSRLWMWLMDRGALVLMGLAAFGVFVFVAGLMTRMLGSPDAWSALAVLVVGLSTPGLALGSLTFLALAQSGRWDICVRDGRITLRHKIGFRRQVHLSRCRWSFAQDHPSGTRVLPLRTPQAAVRLQARFLRVRCGWTAETAGLWIGLCALAEVPYGGKRAAR